MAKILMGIGNTLLGDDGVGPYIAMHLDAEGWIAIDCGTVPENFTGVVRKHAPGLLVLADAADMGLSPGEFRVVPETLIEEVGIGTHSLPLTHLISYLSPDIGKVVFIGIQPEVIAMKEGLSDTVREAAEKVIRILKTGDLQEIPVL